MKFVRSNQKAHVFDISPQEKKLLDEVLRRYPLIPATHHRLSKKTSAGETDENQRLLEESLAAQRTANRKQVQAMLEKPGHFQATEAGLQLTVSRPEIECLLQVLNDVRVGSWIALGSPDPDQGRNVVFNNKLVPHFQMMELAGAFEMVFLDAMSGR